MRFDVNIPLNNGKDDVIFNCSSVSIPWKECMLIFLYNNIKLKYKYQIIKNTWYIQKLYICVEIFIFITIVEFFTMTVKVILGAGSHSHLTWLAKSWDNCCKSFSVISLHSYRLSLVRSSTPQYGSGSFARQSLARQSFARQPLGRKLFARQLITEKG